MLFLLHFVVIAVGVVDAAAADVTIVTVALRLSVWSKRLGMKDSNSAFLTNYIQLYEILEIIVPK